jgi:hypothetical protein
MSNDEEVLIEASLYNELPDDFGLVEAVAYTKPGTGSGSFIVKIAA